MAFAASSEDITLAQSFLYLLDKRFGGKARAFLVVIATIVIPAVISALNFFIDHSDLLPATGPTVWISSSAAGVLVFLGKFTPFFKAVVSPPAKVDAQIVVPAPEAPPVAPEPPVVPQMPDIALAPPPPPAGLLVPKPVAVAIPIE